MIALSFNAFLEGFGACSIGILFALWVVRLRQLANAAGVSWFGGVATMLTSLCVILAAAIVATIIPK